MPQSEEIVDAEGAVRKLCQRIEELEPVMHGQIAEIQPSSLLWIDDLAVDPLRMSSAAVRSVVSAIDHLHTLRVVLSQVGMPVVSGFTLMRGAFEASAAAVWLLEPHNADERHLRLLQDAWTDFADANTLIATEGQISESVAVRENNLTTATASAGIALKNAREKTSTSEKLKAIEQFVSAELGRDADQSSMLKIWRVLSGAAHARDHIFELYLRSERVGDIQDDGTQTTKFSQHPMLFAGVLALVVSLTEIAVELYETLAVSEPG